MFFNSVNLIHDQHDEIKNVFVKVNGMHYRRAVETLCKSDKFRIRFFLIDGHWDKFQSNLIKSGEVIAINNSIACLSLLFYFLAELFINYYLLKLLLQQKET